MGHLPYWLAAECDIEKTQIYRIEGGKINTTLSTPAVLARAFNLTLEELVRVVPYQKGLLHTLLFVKDMRRFHQPFQMFIQNYV